MKIIFVLSIMLASQIFVDAASKKNCPDKLDKYVRDTLKTCYDKKKLEEVKIVYKELVTSIPDYCNTFNSDDVKKCVFSFIGVLQNQQKASTISKGLKALWDGGRTCVIELPSYAKNLEDYINKGCP
ncbi:uncharacterized protein LOC115890803 [Sitophilus oryzae]|uniref:Uncharacterized protein LOC115890803 n=1 Tax=Sitophilus oryzae TaxID=7048 RepID=A0A6J2YUQ1_SITOR|nr:uncharacterized protein LOC115890803 [Sitophilus oryzae]